MMTSNPGSNANAASVNIIMNNAIQLSNSIFNSLPPNFYDNLQGLFGQLLNSGRSYRPATEE